MPGIWQAQVGIPLTYPKEINGCKYTPIRNYYRDEGILGTAQTVETWQLNGKIKLNNLIKEHISGSQQSKASHRHAGTMTEQFLKTDWHPATQGATAASTPCEPPPLQNHDYT